jgi:predicted Zn-dependent protease with MMP-like domain
LRPLGKARPPQSNAHPRTEHALWDMPPEPARVVLYQKNIEAYAADRAADEGLPVDDIIREEVRLTLLHELGHFFGLYEDALEDV